MRERKITCCIPLSLLYHGWINARRGIQKVEGDKIQSRILIIIPPTPNQVFCMASVPDYLVGWKTKTQWVLGEKYVEKCRAGWKSNRSADLSSRAHTLWQLGLQTTPTQPGILTELDRLTKLQTLSRLHFKMFSMVQKAKNYWLNPSWLFSFWILKRRICNTKVLKQNHPTDSKTGRYLNWENIQNFKYCKWWVKYILSWKDGKT